MLRLLWSKSGYDEVARGECQPAIDGVFKCLESEDHTVSYPAALVVSLFCVWASMLARTSSINSVAEVQLVSGDKHTQTSLFKCEQPDWVINRRRSCKIYNSSCDRVDHVLSMPCIHVRDFAYPNLRALDSPPLATATGTSRASSINSPTPP